MLLINGNETNIERSIKRLCFIFNSALKVMLLSSQKWNRVLMKSELKVNIE
jgi:hypothetical protein